jgi:hypothetical protein
LERKNVPILADVLTHLDINILNIEEEEEALRLLSGSETSSISNIK